MNFSEYKQHHKVQLCVVGGGLSGLFAAVSAARHGTQVLLTLDAVIGEIEDVNMLRKFNEELEVPLLAPQQM